MIDMLLFVSLAVAPPTNFCVLSVEERGSKLLIMEPDGTLRAQVEVGHWPHEVETSPDGRTAYISQFGITDYDTRIGIPGDHVSEVDLDTARDKGRFVLPGNLRGPHGVKLRPGSPELFVNAEAGGDTMLVYDQDNRRLLRQFPLIKGSHNFVFSPDGKSLFVFAGAQGVARYDASTGTMIAHRVTRTPIRGLRIAADGNVLAAGKGEVLILEPRKLDVLGILPAPVPSQLIYLEALADGTIVAPSIEDGGVVWFPKTGPARFIPTGKGALSARLGPDGRLYVSNADEDHLTVMSTDGKILREAGKDIRGPNGLSFGVCPLVGGIVPERG